MKQYCLVQGFHRINIFDIPYLVSGKETRKRYPVIAELNEVSSFIWDQLMENKNPEQIAYAIADKFEVEYEQALKDTDAFCEMLCRRGYLSVKENYDDDYSSE